MPITPSLADPNRSLLRGLEILRAFRPGSDVLGNAEIAERTGLPKSTVSRLTGTLLQAGFLFYSPRHRGYSLGVAVLTRAPVPVSATGGETSLAGQPWGSTAIGARSNRPAEKGGGVCVPMLAGEKAPVFPGCQPCGKSMDNPAQQASTIGLSCLVAFTYRLGIRTTTTGFDLLTD